MTEEEICRRWIEQGFGDDCFWEGWPECPTPDHSLTPKDIVRLIEEKRRFRIILEGTLSAINTGHYKQLMVWKERIMLALGK